LLGAIVVECGVFLTTTIAVGTVVLAPAWVFGAAVTITIVGGVVYTVFRVMEFVDENKKTKSIPTHVTKMQKESEGMVEKFQDVKKLGERQIYDIDEAMHVIDKLIQNVKKLQSV
jgi:hypothetical protein